MEVEVYFCMGFYLCMIFCFAWNKKVNLAWSKKSGGCREQKASRHGPGGTFAGRRLEMSLSRFCTLSLSYVCCLVWWHGNGSMFAWVQKAWSFHERGRSTLFLEVESRSEKKGVKAFWCRGLYVLLLNTTSLREKGWAFSFDPISFGWVMWPSLDGADH